MTTGKNGFVGFDILLIEDSRADIRLTREVFRDIGMPHTLHAVTNGEDALDFLYRRNHYSDAKLPGLILLDLHIPKIDGRRLLRQIKTDDALLHIPVIVLSTSGNEDDIIEAYRLHANAYITKPLSVSDFEDVIRRIRQFWIETAVYPGAETGGRA